MSCSKVQAACNIVGDIVQISILQVINTAMSEDYVHRYLLYEKQSNAMPVENHKLF